MSPQDAMFTAVEDERNPMHIGSVSVFEGPAPTYGDLVRTVASHLSKLPRYRQRVRFVPLGLGRPVWVDDPHFQILYHVRHTATGPCPSAIQLSFIDQAAGCKTAANVLTAKLTAILSDISNP